MPKADRLQNCVEPALQAARRAGPRLVYARDDASGSGLSSGKPPRILIVEDDVLVAGEMELELAAAGFDVVGVATSAEDAIRLAREEKPHVTVMDIRLEGERDGIEAATEIFRSLGIRSLFVSAFHDPETRRRAEPSAPLGWLPKPYSMNSLVDAVRSALRNLGYAESS